MYNLPTSEPKSFVVKWWQSRDNAQTSVLSATGVGDQAQVLGAILPSHGASFSLPSHPAAWGMCGKQRSGSPEKGQQWCDTPPPCILSSWLCLTVERGLGQLRGAAGTQPRQTGHLPVKTWMPSGRCLGSLEGTPLLSCPPCS